MSDSVDTLIRMVNQIAVNLAYEDDPAAATAQHIRHFWTPQMRQRLIAHGDAGLSRCAAQAMDRLADR